MRPHFPAPYPLAEWGVSNIPQLALAVTQKGFLRVKLGQYLEPVCASCLRRLPNGGTWGLPGGQPKWCAGCKPRRASAGIPPAHRTQEKEQLCLICTPSPARKCCGLRFGGETAWLSHKARAHRELR